MSSSQSVSPYFVIEVLRAARTLGLSEVAARYEPLVTEVQQASGRMPLLAFCQMLREFEETKREPDIGLLLGQRLEPAGFNVLGHLVMASTTVGDALRHVQQFQGLVIDGAVAECREESELFVFSWCPRVPLPVAERPLIDLILAAMRAFGVWVTGITEPFAEIRFQYAKPARIEQCFRLFGHGGIYQCRENAFAIPRSWCDRPIRSASENLKPLLYQQAEVQLAQIQSSEGFVLQIIDLVTRLLPSGHASVERVADLLGVSPRSIQRRLNDNGHSFSHLLQQVRLRLANYYLQNTALSLTEIASRLGYREHSAFSNAYKRWTGRPPRAGR